MMSKGPTKRPARICAQLEDVTENVVAFHQWADFREQINLLNRCTTKYPQAARDRLALFARYLREGHPIPTDAFDQFCGWLESIAQGEDSAEVLGIKKRGRKKPGPTPDPERLERLNNIARTIWHIHRGHGGRQPAPLNSTKDCDGAIEEAAAEFSVSEGEARLAWEVWGAAWLELERTWVQGLPNLKPLNRGRTKDPKP